jgi:hypothetical protein
MPKIKRLATHCEFEQAFEIVTYSMVPFLYLLFSKIAQKTSESFFCQISSLNLTDGNHGSGRAGL